ncbi:receptor-like kinase TMK2 [Zingiber officinale]|uniref:receptor-like kinase TMK2 n=1 Tax=Zingiber officinale TaxID=94328 RepID=UPI001C4C650B|nr:receptor-like kinase TMK2 [Zingiber officinale]
MNAAICKVFEVLSDHSPNGRAKAKVRGIYRNMQTTVEHHYRFDVFNAAIDFILIELNTRFNESSVELLSLSTTLAPKNSFESINIDDICKLAMKFYPEDFTNQDIIALKYELDGVICSRDRIIAINLAQSGISGSLSPVHGNLTSLTSLQLEFNNICDPLPRLSKLSLLQKIYLQANAFDDIPSGFFIGLSSLQEISLDDLPLTPWSLSQDITSATGLVYFSAINAYLTGLIPDFLGSLSSLDILHLSYNKLTSPLPSSFAGSILMKLFLDHQQSRDKISG